MYSPIVKLDAAIICVADAGIDVEIRLINRIQELEQAGQRLLGVQCATVMDLGQLKVVVRGELSRDMGIVGVV